MNNALPHTRPANPRRTAAIAAGFAYMGGASDYDTINGTPCVEIDCGGHRMWFREQDTQNIEGDVYVSNGAQRIR